MIARRTGQVTEFGKLADPIADKALTGTALIGLSILELLPWWVTVVILVREVGVTLLRFWVIRHGVIAASRGGKLKTVVQALAIGLYILPLTGLLASARWWVMAAAARAHRDHRARLRLPGADPAPDQRAGHEGRGRPPGRRSDRRQRARAPTPPPDAAGRRAVCRRSPRCTRRCSARGRDRRGRRVADRRAVLRDAGRRCPAPARRCAAASSSTPPSSSPSSPGSRPTCWPRTGR